MVECIKFNPELRYTQDQLAQILPIMPDGEQQCSAEVNAVESSARNAQSGLVIVGSKCLFIQHCKKNARTLSEPDWYAMITNLALFSGGEEVIHKLSKPYHKYDFQQCQAKIEHFFKSGTKPITCRKIAENGFMCPRRDSCEAKSPAGLAFKPLTLLELGKVLQKQKEVNFPVADLQTARQFIVDYLFNQDASLVEPYIKYDLRKYFGYKADDIRPLIAAYKEIQKKFKEFSNATADRNDIKTWYEYNNTGGLRFLPGILANHLAEKFNAFYCTEQYYFYDNGVYSPRNDKDAKATVRKYMYPREATMNHINDAEGQWQLLIRKPLREINSNPFIINARNGLYNVLDDFFKPHDSGYFSTVQLKASYDPEAKCPRFIEFLHSVLDVPEVDLLQEIYGYLIVPITKAQKSFIFCGLPNVGKSKILQVVQDILLGADNVSNIPLQNLSDRFQPAELFGKLANIYADLPDKSISDVGMFKAATGEDWVTGERKHKDPFSFKPYARFMYSCNDIPRNYGDRSEAFYRRLIIIRFSKPVPTEKRDLQLFEKLMPEADGILTWSITGLNRLIANNYQFVETAKTQAEIQQYKMENNSVLSFAAECCIIEPEAISLRQEVYNAYKEYCDEGSLKPMGQSKFNNDMANIPGIVKADEPVTRHRIFKGVRLL